MERFLTYHVNQIEALHQAERLTGDGYFIHMSVNPPTPQHPEPTYWLEVVDDEFLQEHYRRGGEKTYHRFFKQIPGWFTDLGVEETDP